MPEDPKTFLKSQAPRGREERWCFTDYELEHPEDCFSEDPFVAWVDEETIREVDPWAAQGAGDLGVIVLRRGEVTSLWGDGSHGVPETVKQYVDWIESLTKPTYYGNNHAQNEDDEEANIWRDVLCDLETGRFIRFIEPKPEKAIEVIEHELPDTD